MTDWTNGQTWRSTAALRFAVLDKTTTQPAKLQQLWLADKLNTFGHVIGATEEWRDVPTVVILVGEEQDKLK